MHRQIERGILLRLFFLLILISVLGLSPRIHRIDLEMKEAGRELLLAETQFPEGAQTTENTKGSASLLAASQHIANAANTMPWRTDLWELAGHTALRAGDSRSAIRYLKRAIQDENKPCFSPQCGISIQGLMDLGDAYQQSGDLSAAIETWTTALELNGMTEKLMERLVNAYVSQDNYPYAISIMRTFASNQPDDAQFLYQLGLYIATQNPEESLTFLDRAAELDTSFDGSVSKMRREILSSRASEDIAYSLVVAGRALASLDEWELASEAFHQATLARPDYGEAWAYLGGARQHISVEPIQPGTETTGKEDGLIELEKALELDPQSVAAHTFLALYWNRQAQYDKALQSIRIASNLDSRNPILKAELASTLAASGDFNGAHEAYLRAISLAPHDPEYQRYLVEFSLRYDYHIEEIALPVTRRLLSQYPEDPLFLDLMAQALIQKGDLATAERFLARAMQIDSQNPYAHLHLGLIYILQENRELSFREFNLVVSLARDKTVLDQARRLMETYFP